MKRRIVGVLTAIVLAAMGTLVLVAYVNSAEDRALAGEKTVNVLVASKPIERGTAASDITGRVKSEKVPVKVRADGAVKDLKTLGDKVASVTVLPGEQIVSGRFVAPGELESVGQVSVPDGYLQVTVSLTPDRAVGGLIEPGSTVGILASFDPFQLSNDQPVNFEGYTIKPDGQTPNSTHLLFDKPALVTSVQVQDATTTTTSGTKATQAPKGSVLVTLALTAPQVEKVVFTAEHGSLWLAYEPKDAPTSGTQVVTRAVIYQ